MPTQVRLLLIAVLSLVACASEPGPTPRLDGAPSYVVLRSANVRGTTPAEVVHLREATPGISEIPATHRACMASHGAC